MINYKFWGCSFLGFSGQSGEGVDLEELDGGVELLLGVLVLILGSGNSNSDLSGYVSNTVRPKESVERSVYSNILNMSNTTKTYLSVHSLLGESLAFSDSSWCSLLESNTLESLVHVEGVVSNSGLQFSGLSSHFCLK